MFCNSLLDAHWKADMTETEAVALMDMCIKELHTRFMISMPNWLIKVSVAWGAVVCCWLGWATAVVGLGMGGGGVWGCGMGFLCEVC